MAKTKSTKARPKAKTKTASRSKAKARTKSKVTSKSKPKAKSQRTKRQPVKVTLPGHIYQRGTRWWWSATLPGEDKPKARPLKADGDKVATNNRKQAEEIALAMWERAIWDAAHKQSKAKADQKVARLKTQFQEKVRDFSQVIERATAKVQAEKRARVAAETKLQKLVAQLKSGQSTATPSPQKVGTASKPPEPPAELEPHEMILEPVQTGHCQCCNAGDIPIADLTRIDSGQLLCPDCLAALRRETEAAELVECRVG